MIPACSLTDYRYLNKSETSYDEQENMPILYINESDVGVDVERLLNRVPKNAYAMLNFVDFGLLHRSRSCRFIQPEIDQLRRISDLLAATLCPVGPIGRGDDRQ